MSMLRAGAAASGAAICVHATLCSACLGQHQSPTTTPPGLSACAIDVRDDRPGPPSSAARSARRSGCVCARPRQTLQLCETGRRSERRVRRRVGSAALRSGRVRRAGARLEQLRRRRGRARRRWARPTENGTTRGCMRPGTRACGSRLALKLCPAVDTIGLSGHAEDGGEWFRDESTESVVKKLSGVTEREIVLGWVVRGWRQTHLLAADSEAIRKGAARPLGLARAPGASQTLFLYTSG
jgi:hypothetical protein